MKSIKITTLLLLSTAFISTGFAQNGTSPYTDEEVRKVRERVYQVIYSDKKPDLDINSLNSKYENIVNEKNLLKQEMQKVLTNRIQGKGLYELPKDAALSADQLNSFYSGIDNFYIEAIDEKINKLEKEENLIIERIQKERMINALEAKKSADSYKATTNTATKTPIREMKREIKMEVQNFKQERKEAKDNLVQEKVLNNATATAKIASKLNITPEQLKAQLSATNTDLKTLLKNASLTKEEVRQILPPVIKERIATTSQNFIPRTLQNIFGPRKEKVTETVNEAGEVEVKVESNAGFFRKFFGF